MSDLVNYEIEIMKQLAGLTPADPWGAAVGATLGFLKGSGYVDKLQGRFQLTEKGLDELRKRGYAV